MKGLAWEGRGEGRECTNGTGSDARPARDILRHPRMLGFAVGQRLTGCRLLAPVQQPCQRQDEERREEHAEQRVEPDERDVERAQSQSHPESAQRSMTFHEDPCAKGVIAEECSDLVGGRPERVTDATLEARVHSSLTGVGRVVLAVSGGRDSMTLLEAAAAVASGSVAAVATFDHGTGAAAAAAADLVAERARQLGLPLRRERATTTLRGEAAWREARWRFLRAVAAELGARVATAHTADDQTETVLMRVLRGAGARGLAGLEAPGDVLRPLLRCSRAAVAYYAAVRGVAWVEDPGNASPAHLRNRVRLDLLPALGRSDPSIEEALLSIGRRAAVLRRDVEHFVAHHLRPREQGGVISVARCLVSGYSAAELALLWPVVAARVGVTLDRRGTRRLAEFTMTGAAGTRIPLSRGYEVVRRREHFVLRRSFNADDDRAVLELRDGLVIGRWRFSLDASAWTDENLWRAGLPAASRLQVRRWAPGDGMTASGDATRRRVKGLLRSAGVDAGSRSEWPVVLADGEIVWIPGVRRGAAATARSGRPAARYRCERIDG